MNSSPLNSNLEQIQTASAYTFSAQSLDTLGAVEYTLATIVIDTSGSLQGYEKDLEKALGEIILACKKSPRSDNLMIRTVFFNDNVNEIHGFKLLGSINPNDFNGTVKAFSQTALYDAVFTSIEATQTYGKSLTDQGFLTNAVLFCVTDGIDNQSKYTPSKIKALVEKIGKDESLESMSVVLISAGEHQTSTLLEDFKNKANITQFVDMGNITPQRLAKLANFVSKSISSTSSALGTGTQSTPLTF